MQFKHNQTDKKIGDDYEIMKSAFSPLKLIGYTIKINFANSKKY